MLDERDARDGVLAGLPLAGKSVIDLRAQRGDNLRRALRAGALYAEGMEPALESVNAGRLINAAYGFDTAVLRCADVEEQRCLYADFDVGLCLAEVEWTEIFLTTTLPRIRELLLVRISLEDEHWFHRQIHRLSSVFPYWALLPYNEPHAVRGPLPQALVAFGREIQAVAMATAGRSEAIGLAHPAIRWIDVQRSHRAQHIIGTSTAARAIILELRQRLTQLAAPDLSELSAAIKPSLPMLSLVCRDLPPRDVDFGTDRYWLRFLQGLVHWIEHDAFTIDNPYVRFIRGVSAHGASDPGMRDQLGDGERALTRLKPRLQRFLEALRDGMVRQPLVLYNPSSLASLREHGYGPAEFTEDRHLTLSNGREYRVQCIDGNHRLAALWLAGAAHAPVLPVWTNVYGDDPVLMALRGPGAARDSGLERRITRAAHELSCLPTVAPRVAWQEAVANAHGRS